METKYWVHLEKTVSDIFFFCKNAQILNVASVFASKISISVKFTPLNTERLLPAITDLSVLDLKYFSLEKHNR